MRVGNCDPFPFDEAPADSNQSPSLLQLHHQVNQLATAGDLQAALALCEQLLTHQPNYLPAWTLRAQLLIETGQDEAAMLAYDQAIALDPELADSLLGDRLRLLRRSRSLWPYLKNQWAPGKRHLGDRIALFYYSNQKQCLWAIAAMALLICWRTGIAGLVTVLAMGLLLAEAWNFKRNFKFALRTYFRSGILAYVRAVGILIIAFSVMIPVYLVSPGWMRWGWASAVMSGGGNWGVSQPFEVADQAAEQANQVQDQVIAQLPNLSPQKVPQIEEPPAAKRKIDFKWVFVPLVWLMFLLVLPRWAEVEEEQFRKGIHAWPQMALSSVKFGLVHLVMGIPICVALTLAVPGFLFACRYKYAYHRDLRLHGNELRAQKAGVLASTADHAIYNAILISLLVLPMALNR
jgi:hypothetical protein